MIGFLLELIHCQRRGRVVQVSGKHTSRVRSASALIADWTRDVSSGSEESLPNN